MQTSIEHLSDEYWDESKAAQFCGVRPHTLRVWNVRRYGPPRIKVGRKVYYRVEALKEWLKSRETCAINQ